MSTPPLQVPGGALASRPLHFIWILDCSGSMLADGKIQALNAALHEVIPHMREVAREQPHAEVLVRALSFSDGARWVVPDPTPVDHFDWQDITADGVTDMGKALFMVSEQLRVPPMSPRALPPVLVLVSDGQPTDDFGAGLNALLAEPWGKKALRVAIGIGRDADYDVLQRFIGTPEMKPVAAHSPEQLLHFIRWASTAVKVASKPKVVGDTGPVIMPETEPVLPVGADEMTW